MRLAALAAATVALCAVAAGSARGAHATVPCWRTVILDWQVDGTVATRYAPQCYRQALRHLRTDLQIYSDARDGIERALAAASFGSGSRPRGGGGGPTRLASWPEGRLAVSPEPVAQPPAIVDSPLNERLDMLLAPQKSSTPVPLYVLGGVAVLLLTAGSTGLIANRLKRP